MEGNRVISLPLSLHLEGGHGDHEIPAHVANMHFWPRARDLTRPSVRPLVGPTLLCLELEGKQICVSAPAQLYYWPCPTTHD